MTGARGAAWPGAVRRWHAGALCALAALLLLLLASRAPAPPRAPRPRPLQHHQHQQQQQHQQPPPAAHDPPAPQHQPPPPPPPPQPVQAAPSSLSPSPPPAPARTKPQQAAAGNATSAPAAAGGGGGAAGGDEERAVLTREVWVAGHERAHPELCPALGARLRLLVLVTSAPAHAAARDAVRLTWGHYAARSDVALAFVLGAPPAALRAALAAEDALYGDLVVGRSLDTYSNLTLKTLSMLEWADTYCPRAPRLLKTDDDMFINVPRLLAFAAAAGRANATRTIWGKVVRRAAPKRTRRSKYYVPAAQFPGRVFPDFATGPAYLVTADAVRALLAAAGRERYLRLEDVFVTGVLAARAGVRRRHAPEFYNRRAPPQPCAAHKAIALHMVRYHEQFDLWRRLLDGRTKCT